MRLFEYEAKEIFAQAGIPTPRSGCARSPGEARETAARIGGPVVLKPQTLAKARGKAGLICFADHPEEAEDRCRTLLGRTHNGQAIEAVLVEEKVRLLAELFLGIAVDYAKASPTVIVSSEGGVDVETTARQRPDCVRMISTSPSKGLGARDAARLVDFLRGLKPEILSGPACAELELALQRLYEIFSGHDCELVEINPMGIREDSSLAALDGFMVVDDEAQFRQAGLVRPRAQSEEEFRREQEFKKKGWTYIPMEGEIGILSSGAGITMAIMDLINLNGGKPANFLDTAQMNRQGMYEAFQIFHHSPELKVLLVNVFAGLNRCDDLALGIQDYLRDFKAPFPIVVRMIGNRDREGREILQSIGIQAIASLEEAVEKAIATARGTP
jgi:succinyl-CoA synthetase beta subunit